ncbi:MAG: type II toxin-antitoxin system PemK/MazF family toxin [Spirochaetaceae bacterium]|nr:type II toxin-antitoxin system PemK/MazF family toxin [Spirochaetaceae bacterium]
MTRGEIWWVDFGIPLGSEVGFKRPVIILQNNILNESNLKTTVVLPLTTNTLYADIPNNILLAKEVTGLPKDSVTQPHLLVHVDKRRLSEKVKKLDSSVLDKIMQGVIATIE